MGMNWSKQDIGRLCHLWNVKGYSAVDCGADLGRSRHSINAQVDRLRAAGTPMRPADGVPSKKSKSTKGTHHKPYTFGSIGAKSGRPPAPPAPNNVLQYPLANDLPSHGKRIHDIEKLLSHHCRWIYGEPHHGAGKFSYCGSTTVPMRSYCPHHLDIVIPKPAPRRTGPTPVYTPSLSEKVFA